MKKLKQHYLNGVDKIKLFYSARRKQKVTLTVLVLVLLLGLGTVGLVAMQKASVEPKPDVVEVVPKDDKDKSDKDESDKDESDKGESDKGESDKGESDKDESDKDESDKDEPDKDEPDKDESDKGESDKGESDKGESETPKADPPKADPPKADPPKADPPKAETPKPAPDKPSSGGGSAPAPKPQPPKQQPPAHTHTWVPQYKNHPAQAAKGYYDYVPPVVTKRAYYEFGDGHKIYADQLPSNDYVDDYAIDHDTNWWTGTETTTVKEGYEVWVETSPAKAAWRELTHYVCQTDGATKQP